MVVRAGSASGVLRTAVGRNAARRTGSESSVASSFLNGRKGLGAVQEHSSDENSTEETQNDDMVEQFVAEEGQTGGAAAIERTRSISGKGGADAAALAEQLRARDVAESEEARDAEGAS